MAAEYRGAKPSIDRRSRVICAPTSCKPGKAQFERYVGKSRSSSPCVVRHEARIHGNTLRLGIALDWLAANPLTVTALHEEIDEWDAAGFKLDIKSLRELEAGAEAQAA